MNYIKPELLVVAIVLYLLGIWMKKAEFVKDKHIPFLLGMTGILICGLWVASVSRFETIHDIFAGIFAMVTQGILVAGLSTYVNQIAKQMKKSE